MVIPTQPPRHRPGVDSVISTKRPGNHAASRNPPDGVLGPADQPGEPLLALDQRKLAQVLAVKVDQVEGVQHRLTAAPSRRIQLCALVKMCFL
jgi:hypothetical protein